MSQERNYYTLEELSTRFGLELRGDGAHRISGVGTLQNATSDQLSFLANKAYRAQLKDTRAGAVILLDRDAQDCPVHCLVADDPYLAYARVATLFDPRPIPKPGIHPTAFVDETATLGKDVSIGPNAVVSANCTVGDHSIIGPCTVLEDDVTIGESCRLASNVSIGYRVRLGDRVIVHANAEIGSDGFGIALATDHWEKVPQVGSVVIGDDCEIGAGSTIDRGAIEDTVFENDVRLDNQVHIAHNAYVGAHTAMAGQSGIAGSSKVGKFCLFGGRAGVGGHMDVADRTTIAALSTLFDSVDEPGTTWSAQIRSQPVKEWLRNSARLRKLDELIRQLTKIAKQQEREPDNDQ